MPSTAHSVYFQNSLATVAYYPTGYIALTWTDVPIQEEDLRALYTHTLHAFMHHATTQLLTDQRRRRPLPPEAQRWVLEEWIPLAIRAVGYSHCAIVECAVPAGRAAARFIGTALEGPLSFEYFDDPTAAAQWLLNQQTEPSTVTAPAPTS